MKDTWPIICAMFLASIAWLQCRDMVSSSWWVEYSILYPHRTASSKPYNSRHLARSMQPSCLPSRSARIPTLPIRSNMAHSVVAHPSFSPPSRMCSLQRWAGRRCNRIVAIIIWMSFIGHRCLTEHWQNAQLSSWASAKDLGAQRVRSYANAQDDKTYTGWHRIADPSLLTWEADAARARPYYTTERWFESIKVTTFQ